jgi:hypothetical protein
MKHPIHRAKRETARGVATLFLTNALLALPLGMTYQAALWIGHLP